MGGKGGPAVRRGDGHYWDSTHGVPLRQRLFRAPCSCPFTCGRCRRRRCAFPPGPPLLRPIVWPPSPLPLRAVALVLGFVGVKILADYSGYHVPTGVSLGVVAGILGLGVGTSLLLPAPAGEEADK